MKKYNGRNHIDARATDGVEPLTVNGPRRQIEDKSGEENVYEVN